MENIFRRMNLDMIGIGASMICAVHCALLPLVFAALPLLGMEITENTLLEYCLLLFSFGIGVLALGQGYLRHHRRLLPLLLFIAGFALLLAGHFWTAAASWEYTLICIGAGAIVGAHLLNQRHRRYCRIHKHH
ncbi:MerC domain-containing protein [Chitinophaga varians]|uniref:MerC domain-containing protein n=1 Tax=Chitinophaga varians TaxID=2202339 RepID=A0A847RVG3_9BACT|nr:MerC domain-containing protein [Chitinophaga varians]NLR64707.1 MerC domain-containing protein [Chitinophaga varians]